MYGLDSTMFYDKKNLTKQDKCVKDENIQISEQ